MCSKLVDWMSYCFIHHRFMLLSGTRQQVGSNSCQESKIMAACHAEGLVLIPTGREYKCHYFNDRTDGTDLARSSIYLDLQLKDVQLHLE